MFCQKCGASLSQEAVFCPTCGSRQNLAAPVASVASAVSANPGASVGQYGPVADSYPGPTRIGYSDRINDPAFARYIKHANSWAVIFSLILAAAAIVGFFIYGESGSEMENPQALYIGLGIGGMFVLIALVQILGRSRSKAWDGVVVDKKIEKKRRKQSTSDDDYYWVDYTQYTVIIRSSSGKIHKRSANDDDTVYNYYQVGDHVRHHKGLNSLEKYDKSRDTIIFCNACATLNNIQDDYCHRCKCPLLK